MFRKTGFQLGLGLALSLCAGRFAPAETGSLLIWPNVEIRWDANGVVTGDTMLTLTNGYPDYVSIQMYFVNGDEPTGPIHNSMGQLIERAHPGWNRAGCQIELSRYQATYWSARTGLPGACSFGVLDSGFPPGRPDPEHPGGRVLRGFIYAWAVDNLGREINWNHLYGDATIFDFNSGQSWSYEAEIFRALTGQRGDVLPEPGVLRLNNVEYEAPYSRLVLNFPAVGDVPLLGGPQLMNIDTYLTLMPVSQDFRQDNDGPLVTKAKFDIVNMNEVSFSGTTRCLTCWDRTALSRYSTPNHFLFAHIHTEVGTARIDGIASPPICGPYSEPAALVGVAVRTIALPTQNGAADWTGDGEINLADHKPFASCLIQSGPQRTTPVGGCPTVFDLDRDGDVDLLDFQRVPFGGIVQRSYSALSLGGEGTESAVIYFDVP